MINRASSQVSKTGSVHSKGTEGGRLTSGSGSEVEMCQVCKSVDLDTISFDIDDNKAWDADTDQEGVNSAVLPLIYLSVIVLYTHLFVSICIQIQIQLIWM